MKYFTKKKMTDIFLIIIFVIFFFLLYGRLKKFGTEIYKFAQDECQMREDKYNNSK